MGSPRQIVLLLIMLGISLTSGCALLVATGVAAGVGTGAAMSQDRRTAGIFVEDEGIEQKSDRLVSEKFGKKVHVNVTSFNRIVLLTGEVPSKEARSELERLVMAMDNVRSVTNELAVGASSSYKSRSNDALITARVEGSFMDAGKFHANNVKVLTEDSVVYLLGLVAPQEADDAVEIARSTNGVRKVVKVFEYLN